MIIRTVKLSGEPKSWAGQLQGFIDDVVSALRGPQNAVPAVVVYKDFEYATTMGEYVDVDLGFTQRPRAIVILGIQAEGTEEVFAVANGIIWSWRNGYARINFAGVELGTARCKVTIMAVL
jgi:hypothetical protein